MCQSFFGVKDRRKTSFEVNDSVFFRVFGLFIGDALQRLLPLHHGDRMYKAFQVLGQASLVSSLVEPPGQRRGILGGKLRVLRVSRQLHNCLGTQHAVQVLVQQDLRKGPQQFCIQVH